MTHYQLANALNAYAEHYSTCLTREWVPNDMPKKCTCGLEALREQFKR